MTGSNPQPQSDFPHDARDESLARDDTYFQTLIEGSLDIVTILSPAGIILYESPAIESLMGWKPQELYGRLVFSLVHPGDRWNVMKAFGQAMMRPGTSQRVELRFQQRDGAWHPIEALGRLIRTPAGTWRVIVNSRDLAERRAMESALLESEEMHRRIFSAARDAIIIFDGETRRITEVNNAAVILYGYAREEFLKLAVEDLSDEPEVSKAFIDAAFAQHGIAFAPLRRHKRKDHGVFDVEISHSQFELKGRTMGMATIRDITASRQAEQMSGRLFTAIERSTDSIVITDERGSIQYVNPAFERLTGYTREEALGQNPRVLKSGLQDSAFYQVMWKTLMAGKPWEGEFINRNRNGGLFREHAVITPVTGESGRITNFVAVKRDITAAYQQEQALRESESRARELAAQSELLRRHNELILNSAAEGIYGIDTSGQITFANRAAAHILGWESGELIGKQAHATMHHSTADRAPYAIERCPIHATFRGQIHQVSRQEIYWKRNGEKIEVEYISDAICENGVVTGVVVVFRDISDRKRLEGITRQSEKMAATGRLAAGVAHELNNPLGVILGFAQSLIRRLSESDPYYKPLHLMEREALRCRDLVQNLLVFSREHKPGFSLRDPVQMLQTGLSLVETQTKMKNIQICTDFPKDIGSIEMDGNQMEQVIINLCTNAIDAMSPGGTLTLRLVGHHDTIEISIADTGTGIPLPIRDRIWEPFFTTKDIGKGTGLGLSLVYETIKKHNGQIVCQSEVGKGSTFTMTLPRAQSKTHSAPDIDADRH